MTSALAGKKVNAADAGTIVLGEFTVNRLGFGAMRLTGDGIWGPPKDRKRAVATLQRAVDLGVNFIDTADSYGPEVSEEVIAEGLHPYPKGLVIATKAGWERPGPGQWTHNASPKHISEAVEGSLKRLRVERIDVLQLHIPDPAVSFDATMEQMVKLKQAGKVAEIGLSNVTQEHVERARKLTPIVSVQNRYSFADREWDFLLDFCQTNSIAFLPWAPLGRGGKAHDLVEEIAKKHGVQPLQVALAWLLKRSPAMLPIPGTSSPEHLEENVAAAALELRDEDLEKLSAVTPPPASWR